MALVREIVSLGRSARMGAKLKVRQPLARVEMILADRTLPRVARAARVADLRRTERQTGGDRRGPEQYITYTVLPNLKRLGPRLGKKPAGASQDARRGRRRQVARRTGGRGQDRRSRCPAGEVSLDRDDIQIRLQAKEGWAAAQGKHCVVVLATELTDELIAEGLRPGTRPRDPGPAQRDRLRVHRPDRGGHRDRFAGTSRGGRAVRGLHPRRNAGQSGSASSRSPAPSPPNSTSPASR